MNKLRNILLKGLLAGSLIFSGCEARDQEKVEDSRIPKTGINQSLILHPDYSRGQKSLGYTLLTDIDFDGSWDIFERVSVGFTTGDASHEVKFKKGYGPAQSMNREFGFVEPEFFRPYE